MYKPDETYIPKSILVRVSDLRDYPDEYVLRPPYQRKTVWSIKQKRQLIDTLFKGYYVPNLVLREIAVKDQKSLKEVIDGQQRITAVQQFMRDEFAMPSDSEFAGNHYSKLTADVRRFFDSIDLSATLIKGIEEKDNVKHHKIATDIFWRLQQGESLNRVEVAHASITSRVRNFLVKYADDVSFDYEAYKTKDENPHKHKIFGVIKRPNDRMQHLGLLGRLLLIEEKGGYTDIKDEGIVDLVDRTQTDTVGDDSFETNEAAKSVLRVLGKLYALLQGDPFITGGGKYPWPEYLVISFYLLVRHIEQFYVWDDAKEHVCAFLTDAFYKRWDDPKLSDSDIIAFRESRQQSSADIRNRDLVLRQLFFEFLRDKGVQFRSKSEKRFFNEAERIAIYRKGDGMCEMCKAEDKPKDECKVPWDEYEADHIVPWSKGGDSDIANAQLLCRRHNRQKGAR